MLQISHRSSNWKTIFIASLALLVHFGVMRYVQVSYASGRMKPPIELSSTLPELNLQMSFEINAKPNSLSLEYEEPVNLSNTQDLKLTSLEEEIEEISLASLRLDESEVVTEARIPTTDSFPSAEKVLEKSEELLNKGKARAEFRYVNTNKGLNLRSEPWGEVIQILGPGIRVELLSKSNQWAQVRHEQLQGWVHASFLSLERLLPVSKINGTSIAVQKRKKKKGIEIKGIPVYSQNLEDPHDPDGGRGKYPKGYCGPTSLQMVLDYFGVNASRDYLALTDLGSGKMYRKGIGSQYGPMIDMAKHLGFEKAEMVFSNTVMDIKERLKQGRPVIVSLKGYLDYLQGGRDRRSTGHIVVVSGIDSKENLVILDPAGKGSRALMSKKEFLKVWRGFMVDLGPVRDERVVLGSKAKTISTKS